MKITCLTFLLASAARASSSDTLPPACASSSDTPPPACPGESFECVGGLVNGTSTPCADECGGSCCVGDQACFGFTGRLCKDDVTCMGDEACFNAAVDVIVGGCNGTSACRLGGFNAGSIWGVFNSCLGENSCRTKAFKGGMIRTLVDSCQGEAACDVLAGNGGDIGHVKNSCIGANSCRSIAARDGIVGNLVDSCQGESACNTLATDLGTVGEVCKSCVGERSCSSMAFMGGAVGTLENSCQGDSACISLAIQGGNVTSVTSSCTEANACATAAGYGGKIGPIENSCVGSRACSNTGSCINLANKGCGSEITSIVNSCVGPMACDHAASVGGFIDGIQGACNDDAACDNAGARGGSIGGIEGTCNAARACNKAGFERSIPKGIKECCNTPDECADATEDTLPGGCPQEVTEAPTKSPTDAPTKNPTDVPTKTPTKTPTDAPVPTNKPTEAGLCGGFQASVVSSDGVCLSNQDVCEAEADLRQYRRDSCRAWCGREGLACTAAWDDGAPCEKTRQINCSRRWNKSSICRCEPRDTNLCNRFLFPKDLIVFDEICESTPDVCEAEADLARNHFESCDSWCQRQDLVCTGAWNDKNRCEKDGRISCGTTGKWASICRCEPRDTNLCNRFLSPTDRIVNDEICTNTEDQCTATADLSLAHRESCDEWCEREGLRCTAAWNDGHAFCQKLGHIPCSKRGNNRSICQCEPPLQH